MGDDLENSVSPTTGSWPKFRLVAEFIALSGCAFWLAACAPTQTDRVVADAGAPASLRIVSWNMEHLAEQNGSGCRPRTDADYTAMREFARDLNADVIAFQEVESASAAARVFDPAEYSIVVEQRAGGGLPMECNGLPGHFLNRQATGFAIRRSIAFERAADVVALSLGDPNLRSAVDVTVTPSGGAAPLRLLSVHLKSGCAGGRGNACSTLERQVPVLESWIDARAEENVAFVVLGDFNRRLAEAGDSIWTEWDDGVPEGADLTLADHDVAPRCDPRYNDFIDHFVLDRRAAARASGFQEQVYAGAQLSDHCPILINVAF